MTRAQVLDHYFTKYARIWGITDQTEMYRYLFEKGPGRRPNIGKMFEGKTLDQIRDAFFGWRRKNVEFSTRMKALHKDPAFAERNRERMKALHKDPAFAERRD
ncbi:MAG: hypothetical protein AABW68_01285, partial [archaeon]